MPDAPVLLIAGLEIAVALVFLIGLLLLRTRNLSRTSAALEQKVIELRQALKAVRNALKLLRADAGQAQRMPDYGELVEAQISATRNHHLTLNPERDIVLDLAADTPAERRAVSLRHAFLIAEKEAWLAGEDGDEIDWDILRGKLGQIIEFYERPGSEALQPDQLEALDLDGNIVPAAADETIALREIVENQKRHIENLERFKKLFFDADEKWQTASRQAEQYRQEIIAQSRHFQAGDEFHALLDRYNRIYMQFGDALAADGGRGSQKSYAAPPDAAPEAPSIGRMVIANQEEVQRLRNMAVDQHKMILRLRQELENASSAEEKDRIINELYKQLERHERFLKESEICTEQLENELERALGENHTLKMKLLELKQESAPGGGQDAEQMSAIIGDFTRQSSDMLTALQVLEGECSDLRQQLGNARADSAATETLQQQLAAAQQELLDLQAQHIELEERYLELKSTSP